MGEATWLVLAGLALGKPLGIALFGSIATRSSGLLAGMGLRDLVVLGCVAAIGLTVSPFVASVAFPPMPLQDAAKMGAPLSFGAAAVAIAASRLLKVERRPLVSTPRLAAA